MTRGRVEQPADHGHLDDRAVERRRRRRPIDGGEPERHVVLGDEQGEEAGADEAHVADGEVDDPGRPVDEHDAHGEQPEHQPVDEPVEEELPGEPALEQREHQARLPLPRKTARARSSRSSELAGVALEADLALLEEHGPVGDRQGDVERLLDDDDRHALAP